MFRQSRGSEDEQCLFKIFLLVLIQKPAQFLVIHGHDINVGGVKYLAHGLLKFFCNSHTRHAGYDDIPASGHSLKVLDFKGICLPGSPHNI